MPTEQMQQRLTTSRAVSGAIRLLLEQDNAEYWIGRVFSPMMSSDSEVENYAWIGENPRMRRWIGGRNVQGLREFGYSIRNEAFEASIEIPLPWMQRDKTGQIRQRIGTLAGTRDDFWADLGSTMIEAGESTLCYDGEYFFDTDHPAPSVSDSATQSNSISVNIGTTTAPTTVEMSESILSATQAILGFKSEKGTLLNSNARRFLIRVPLAYMGVAAAALGSQVIADTVSRTNTLVTLGTLGGFQYELWVDPRSTWTTKYAMFRADGKNHALFRQEEKPLEVKAKAEGSEYEFDHNAHQYGIDARWGAGYGFWESAILVTHT